MEIMKILDGYGDMGFVMGCLGFIVILYLVSRIGENSRQLPDKPEFIKKNKRGDNNE